MAICNTYDILARGEFLYEKLTDITFNMKNANLIIAPSFFGFFYTAAKAK
jgi:hypothetical protein